MGSVLLTVRCGFKLRIVPRPVMNGLGQMFAVNSSTTLPVSGVEAVSGNGSDNGSVTRDVISPNIASYSELALQVNTISSVIILFQSYKMLKLSYQHLSIMSNFVIAK